MSQFESDFEQKLYAQRQEKLREISAIGERLGLSAAESIYPNRFPASDEHINFAHIPDLLSRYDSESAPVSAETIEAEHPEFAVAGRIMSIRLQGKAGRLGRRFRTIATKLGIAEIAASTTACAVPNWA